MSGGSLTPDALAAAIELAKEDGFEVVQSNDRTLLLDLDSAWAREQFDRVLPIVNEHIGVDHVEEWSSKSGNTHVKVVLIQSLPIDMRVLLQAALGSDGVREALALVQHRNGCEEPSVLFKPTLGTGAREA